MKNDSPKKHWLAVARSLRRSGQTGSLITFAVRLLLPRRTALQ